MELTWYGRTCIRLRGKDAVVVADAYQSIVGPTGRGISGEIVTYSHPDDRPLSKAKGHRSRDGLTLLPSSLDDAFVLDGPGEYEVRDVLLTEEKLADIGPIDIACVPVGGALSPQRIAELVAQLDPKIVVAMPLDEDAPDTQEALAKFLHEMGGAPAAQPKLSVTISSLPAEVSTVLLESRGKV